MLPETENHPRRRARLRPHRIRRRRLTLLGLVTTTALGAAAFAFTDLGSSPPSGARASLAPGGHGDGSFTTAAVTGPAIGHGIVRRYKVEVEKGIGIDPKAAATQIQGILADPRSWTTDGVDSFQPVTDYPYDFTVRIASPATVDRLCGAAGLQTNGEVNCDVGRQVMVNSKRWTTGSPQFSGSLDDYRALIVNHEVGHRIGHGHEGCPGPGKPAPAMMQQIYGLAGCLPNAWPYDAAGNYLTGPSVP
ncbi:DUF3152 domain-containing protein [Kitasatospora sp. McL0602]|uniref:DUF3152 domain-containing protein n=1 Tax=Kitasatospora sp. McL0602 TaxID=3439530 RepID=UPI003F88C19C